NAARLRGDGRRQGGAAAGTPLVGLEPIGEVLAGWCRTDPHLRRHPISLISAAGVHVGGRQPRWIDLDEGPGAAGLPQDVGLLSLVVAIRVHRLAVDEATVVVEPLVGRRSTAVLDVPEPAVVAD